MPQATRLGDLTTGEGIIPPVPSVEASPNVFVNSLGWVRQNDAYALGELVSGSPTVFVNHLQAGRIDDPTSVAGPVAEGSPNVFAGDGGGGSPAPPQPLSWSQDDIPFEGDTVTWSQE